MTTLEELWVAAYDPNTRRHIEYPGGSLIDAFGRFTRTYADRPALDFFGERTSYAELRREVGHVAGNLYELGVRPGDHVALLMPTCPQHVVAIYAVWACGATVVEHNPLYTARELTPLFEDHGADVAIVWDAAAPNLESLPEEIRPSTIVSINLIEEMPLSKRLLLRLPLEKARKSREQLSKPAPGTVPFSALREPTLAPPASVRPGAEDIALLLYTSGTTGVPKGVPLTHANLLADAAHAIEWVYMLDFGNDVFMTCLPLFHIFGLSMSMNAGLTAGAMLHLIPKPETGLILDAVKRKMPTLMIAVPPLFERVVDAANAQGVSLRGLHSAISGAMPLRPDLIEKWEAATGGYLIEGYGLSETSPIVTGNPMNPSRTPASIGIPFSDTDVRLVDPDDPSRDVPLGEKGEILVKGAQVFHGYRNNPEETEAAFHDGWFRTGDIAVADERGFLYIVDRIKEVVITGGFNVYPSEVEEALRGEGGINDIAVVGLVNELGMEEVVAAVVTGEGLLPDLEEFRERAKERLAAYKVPRRVYLLPELPRNEMGKVLRKDVRAALQERDLKERVTALGPELRAWFATLGPEVREWLETTRADVAEHYEGSELQESLEKLDADFREWIGGLSAYLREQVEALELERRIELVRATLSGDDDGEESSEPVSGDALEDEARRGGDHVTP